MKVKGLYDKNFEHDGCGVGFVADVKGQKRNKVIKDAITALKNLNHRGASGYEEGTGDGAGILFQIPDRFFRAVLVDIGVELPEEGKYAVGMMFLPVSSIDRTSVRALFDRIVEEMGCKTICWRKVPVDDSMLGKTAKESRPVIEQVFVEKGKGIETKDEFERKLFLIRKKFEKSLRSLGVSDNVYVASLSCYTIVYKGMLVAHQLEEFYLDLKDEKLESCFCMFHSRFSTNTFPSWQLAQPFRMLSHNGEINTLRGNINWMRAREHVMNSSFFSDRELDILKPVIYEGYSDSAILDQVFELLVKAGRSPQHAMLMMIPEAWENNKFLDEKIRSFYEYHSCLMEPWDGPAFVSFTDGKVIGASLDRNGLRPGRYVITKDDYVVVASEAGVVDIPPEIVRYKGKLEPGRMFFIDFEKKKIVDDEEIKLALAKAKPYREWVKKNLVYLEDIPAPRKLKSVSGERSLLKRQIIFGYTEEDISFVIKPMVERGLWNLGSMGNDTPLAVLSRKPQLLFNYFKQMFAQVTNPPLDPIREEMVTTVQMVIGREANILEPGEDACKQIMIRRPILTVEELDKLKSLDGQRGFRAKTYSILFDPNSGHEGMEETLDRLFEEVENDINSGVNVVILSDRGVGKERVPIPSLLACAGLHNYLVDKRLRTSTALIVETGDAREVHHFSLLIGYGASAICPYLAYETIEKLFNNGELESVSSLDEAIERYIQASIKGVVKVMSKMGISTISSYHGAQIFEAVGLGDELIEKYFKHTISRIGGIGLKHVFEDVLRFYKQAYGGTGSRTSILPVGGQFQWFRTGEYHAYNPETIFRLQLSTRRGDYKLFKQFSKFVNEENKEFPTIRSLFDFAYEKCKPVPIDEVEPVDEIVKRFGTSAMSFGSISKEAHETLAIAMNMIGGWSNTGEGGEDPERYRTMPDGKSRRCRIKQVASGRFGVTAEYLSNADEIQIKIAQGAKPGEGGELPGKKVYPWIAKVRYTTPGVTLISPPPHHDIYSIEDLAQLIHDLKCANPRARISVKLTAEAGVGTVAAGVTKARSDVILISGHDGGTGASPLTSIKYAGIPWELGLAEVQQTLVINNLRDKVTLQVDGQLKTGRDVVIGALLGAEEFGFGTAALIVLGCVMMRKCHKNQCPVGIATQDPELRKKFSGKPEYLVNFMRFVAQEVREYMARLGFRRFDEMVGRSDLLKVKKVDGHPKANSLRLERIIEIPEKFRENPVRKIAGQDHQLEKSLDNLLIEKVKEAIETKKPVCVEMDIKNTDLSVGAMLGNRVVRKWGGDGLPEDTIRVKFRGSAGQSFGAFLPRGITFTVEGDTNDYIGKGLSGGKIIVYPPVNSDFRSEENIIIGNVAFYGATSGKAFICGRAGERFCVRNSGVYAVVEGVGDHCCEYMTGGIVVVIGRVGRNFASGMSGGVAFVWDIVGDFRDRCNMDMVDIEPLKYRKDESIIRELLLKHYSYTGSTVALHIIINWQKERERFVKVIPKEYKRIVESGDSIDEMDLKHVKEVVDA